MNCPKCGNLITQNMKFCKTCGTPVAIQQQTQTQVNVQPKQPVQQKSAKAPKTSKKKSGGKNNLALKVIAIILVIAVLASGGLLLADNLMYKNEIKADEYITDFPVLKQKTDFLVYNAEKFPSTNYKIKVERLLNGGILKSEALRKTEIVVDDVSTTPVYNLNFKEDGSYRITLEDISVTRTQPVTTTTSTTTSTTTTTTVPSTYSTVITEEDSSTETETQQSDTTTTQSSTTTTTTTQPTETTTTMPTSEETKEQTKQNDVIIIIIDVEVENDSEEAVDKVDVNSKEGDGPIELPTVASAPVDSIEFNGHYYKMFDSSMTWQEAKAECESLGGHLVTVTSQEEQDFIQTLIENGEKNQYWLGLDTETGWVTGEELLYTNWDAIEPNHCSRSDGQVERFVHIFRIANPRISSSVAYAWNDMYNDNTYPREESNFSLQTVGFICEWE